MTDILPRYKVAFDDLKDLGIGDFLTSREFRIFMSKKGYYEPWVDFVKEESQKRRFVSVGFDHEYFDSCNALAEFFNSIQNNQVFESIIAVIISEFINSKKFKLNFDHLKDSLELIEFSRNSLDSIFNEIELNSQKPEKPEKVYESSKNRGGTAKANKSKVFIVHGHHEGLKQSVARFLDRLKLTPIIISEMPSGGKTIVEQIEANSDVDFAVVLMTGDDEGRKKGEKKLKNRARQNVILELGYFYGKLGRPNVLVIYESGVEIPSDFLGILHVPFDSEEAWKMKLAKELKNSKFSIDFNDGF